MAPWSKALPEDPSEFRSQYRDTWLITPAPGDLVASSHLSGLMQKQYRKQKKRQQGFLEEFIQTKVYTSKYSPDPSHSLFWNFLFSQSISISALDPGGLAPDTLFPARG